MSEEESSSPDPENPEENGETTDRNEPPGDAGSAFELPTLPAESPAGESEKGAVCPTCGAEIPPEAPRGLCPKCALAGAAAPTDVDSVAERSRSGPRFEPPTIETIAAAFPQLEIVELIGCGGMGAVYKARQPHLDRFVALKILPPSLAETPSFTERFTREGRLLARLSHPAIVGVHDFGQAGGFFYLLMEYVDGVNLRQAMRAGRFTPEQALEVAPKICEALQFAHDEGVLHRDIKPENILLDTRGAVKIADFGIAKLLDEAAGADPTLTGSMAPGTPHYMAPEQIEQPATVDHRADIYSLGVVFYEMLTGELPIGRFAAPSEKAAVDSQVDEIVFRSLEKERDRRQQSAGEVKTEIEGIPVTAIATERHPGYRIPAGSRAPAPSGGGKAAAFVLAAFLIPVFLNLILFVFYGAQQRDTARDRAQSEMAQVQAVMRLQTAKDRASQLESELNDLPAGNEAERARMTLQLEGFGAEVERLSRSAAKSRAEVSVVHRSVAWMWVPFGSLSLLGLLILAIGVPGTLMGWKSLRRIRALNLPEGRVAPLFAALFWPLLLSNILIFMLISVPMGFGPKWVSAIGVSLSLVVSGLVDFWAIRAALRWMKTPATESERSAALADSAKSSNPWLRRLVWLALFLIALPFGAIAFYLSLRSSSGPGGGLVPGFMELVIVAAIIGFFVFLVRLLVRRSRPAAAPASGSAGGETPVNPWPRRIFWLLIAIVVAPVLLILLGLLVPWMAHEKPPGKSHSVRIAETSEEHHSVAVRLESRRFTGGNVNVKLQYEGPDFPGGDRNSHDQIYPGQGQEWDLFGAERFRSDAVNFVFPDRQTAGLAGQAILRAMENQRTHTDVGRIDLFDVAAPDGDRFQAWVEIRSNLLERVEFREIEEQ